MRQRRPRGFEILILVGAHEVRGRLPKPLQSFQNPPTACRPVVSRFIDGVFVVARKIPSTGGSAFFGNEPEAAARSGNARCARDDPQPCDLTYALIITEAEIDAPDRRTKLRMSRLTSPRP